MAQQVTLKYTFPHGTTNLDAPTYVEDGIDKVTCTQPNGMRVLIESGPSHHSEISIEENAVVYQLSRNTLDWAWHLPEYHPQECVEDFYVYVSDGPGHGQRTWVHTFTLQPDSVSTRPGSIVFGYADLQGRRRTYTIQFDQDRECEVKIRMLFYARVWVVLVSRGAMSIDLTDAISR